MFGKFNPLLTSQRRGSNNPYYNFLLYSSTNRKYGSTTLMYEIIFLNILTIVSCPKSFRKLLFRNKRFMLHVKNASKIAILWEKHSLGATKVSCF